ncbi:tRNA (N(6)-L-threonylcarbamoyladenosine(37)-C(2))-methylthiotransferase MtaB [bacterium]|jgi:threonylcarbamoyladenosine tRNA methylthiotransferase MtaB|nr:tRNA (N(6)-L-threonylcarbamoyladenosine(37)-C(2))-methylthiotransferase MtaB [bacterium]
MPIQARTVAFYNQGCRLNQSETAIMTRHFEESGFSVVDFKVPADIVVINTCTVTENGDSDARRLVNKAVRTNPDTKVALVGCMAQIQKDKLLKWPNVTWVVGNADKMRLPAIVGDIDTADGAVIAPKMDRKPFTLPTAGIDPKHCRANIKIQDGCDFYCAFCIIPFARGPARSRQFDDCLKESRLLTESGHQEIVITGINLGTYSDGDKGFIDVIDALEDLPLLRRIRISSIEPTTIPIPLIEKMADPESKVCNYLHIPIQSATDEVLGLMKRKYTLDEFTGFIDQVMSISPSIGLGTDVIVGFPGETDELFESAYEYLLESPFFYFHVFSYSEREMARSRKMDGQVPKSVIAERSRRLRELSTRKKQVYMEQMIGTKQSVLFEQIKKDQWVGHTEHYVPVRVNSDTALKNVIGHVNVTQLGDGFLLGEVIVN